MEEVERVARLEERILVLDREVAGIKEELAAARARSERSALDSADLKAQLTNLIKALEDHQEWHAAKSEKTFKATDIILALGMLFLAFMEFLRG